MLKQIKRAISTINTCLKYQIFSLNQQPSTIFKLLIILEKLHPAKIKLANQAERLQLCLEELGTIYIKFGQMLATRQLFSDPQVTAALKRLQDTVEPFDNKTALNIIAAELNKPIAEVFSDFQSEPIAAASIAQIYKGTLKARNEKVIIKVARPNIKQKILLDIQIIAKIIKIIEAIKPNFKRLKLAQILRNYQKSILKELNLQIEANQTKKLKANAQKSDILYVPAVYEKLSTKKMLILEEIKGINIDDIEQLKAKKYNLKNLAENGVKIFFTQVFRDNFFHADMHAGNIFIQEGTQQNPKYIGIDCAAIGTLTKEDKYLIAKCLLGFFKQQYQDIVDVFVNYGWSNGGINTYEFQEDIAGLCEPLFMKPFHEIGFGQFLLDLFNIADSHNIEMQPQLFLLQKTILYIEGLGTKIYPELDLWSTAQPFLEQWMKEQIGGKAILNDSLEQIPKAIQNLPQLPLLIRNHLQIGNIIASNQEKILKQQEQTTRYQFIITGCLLLAIVASVANNHLDAIFNVLKYIIISALLYKIYKKISKNKSQKKE